jgi:hypothetical protein
MKRMTMAILASLLALATGASATTQATGTNTVAPKMNMTVNIQKAVSLTLKTGNAAVAHCAVTGAGGGADYNMDFGTVDALGINGGNCNKINPANPGVDNAIYWSDYQITPVFTSHTASSGTTVTAQVTTDFGGSHNVFVVRDALNSSTVPAAATDFTAMGVASADSIGGGSITNGAALTRFIGVAVKPDNNATVLQGSQTATVTFTLTVQ